MMTKQRGRIRSLAKVLVLATTSLALPATLTAAGPWGFGLAAAQAKGSADGAGKSGGPGTSNATGNSGGPGAGPGTGSKPDGKDKSDNAGKNAGSGSSNAGTGGDNARKGTGSGHALGRTAVVTLYNGTTESYLRFANLSGADGRVTVTLHDTATGAELGQWHSPVIPGRGALETGIDAIGAAAGLGERTQAVARIAADFRGQVQHLGWSGGASGTITALTSCPRLEVPKRALGFVAGPGRTAAAAVIQIVNSGPQARAATLKLTDAATGAELGTWISPDIAAFAAHSIAVADLAKAAGVDAATAALTVRLDGSADHVALAYLEGVGGGPLSDLTAGCPLKGGGPGSSGDGADDDDEDDTDDDDDADDDDTSG